MFFIFFQVFLVTKLTGSDILAIINNNAQIILQCHLGCKIVLTSCAVVRYSPPQHGADVVMRPECDSRPTTSLARSVT
jgi:hypothetical protein